ncbi:hypothetical protein QAD02_021581 [Eretmocerus hayati]|uniref:Uncharacterized protein n=1 Tax=Eretmocerus hayati TaxID=131215 RepID=A0ACC2PRP1_9HYME|nr:hypothetical protein QAD02_021581 [Eretmocerus hayati]
MENEVQTLNQSFKKVILSAYENLKVSKNLYEAAKRDLLQKTTTFENLIVIYKDVLHACDTQDSDLLDLSPMHESTTTQTESFHNATSPSVSRQTLREMRDASVSVTPTVECGVYGPFSQKSRIQDASSRHGRYNDDEYYNGAFTPRPPASTQRAAEVTSVTYGGLSHSIHAPHDGSPAPHRERADNISAPTEAAIGHATPCDSARTQTFIGKTPQTGYALSQQRTTPPIKIISDIQLPTGHHLIRGLSSNMNSLQRIELVMVDPGSVAGRSVSSIPDLLLQERAIATIDPLEVSINGEPTSRDRP